MNAEYHKVMESMERRITQLERVVTQQGQALEAISTFIVNFQPVAVDLRIEGTIHRVTILAVPPKPPEEKPTFTIVT